MPDDTTKEGLFRACAAPAPPWERVRLPEPSPPPPRPPCPPAPSQRATVTDAELPAVVNAAIFP